jgi:DNA-binding CsgD family transcriptional regulator
MSETASDKDLRALMAFIEESRQAEPDGVMPWSVLDGLRDLVRCDCMGFTESDSTRKVFLTEQFGEDQNGERYLEHSETGHQHDQYWTLSPDFGPCQYLVANGNRARVLMFSDFYTIRELKNTPFVSEISQGALLYRMTIPLPAGPGRARRVHFDRDTGPDFTERDRMIAEILRPHLYEIYLEAQRQQRGVPRLSRRELEVLQLAGQGMSNADIAKELFVSISTVRKHLEHIFDRAGVRTRIAAAAMILPHVSAIDPH